MTLISDRINGTLSAKTIYIYCIILTIPLLCILYCFISFSKLGCKIYFFFILFSNTAPSFYFTSFLSMKFNSVNLRNKYNNTNLVWPVDPLLLNLTFSFNKVYHHNGVAYDYHSQNELGKTQAGHRWKVWPLPNETEQNSTTNYIEISPFHTSKLPFIDVIYVISAPHLAERHASLKRAFHQQGVSMELLEWKMKWTFTTCSSDLSHSYIYQRLNLQDKPLSNLMCGSYFEKN
jgi:hypothetical protein